MSSAAVVARRSKPQNRIKASADAYVHRMLADVNVYLNWLTTNSVKGMIGEFGVAAYDDSYAYARFAEALYGALVGGPDVWLTSWLASENYPNHMLAAYRGDNTTAGQTATALTTRTWVGRILEQHKGVGRGVNLGNSGENGAFFSGQAGDTQAFSNAREVSGYTFGTGGTIVSPGSDHFQGGANVQQWNYGSSATWAYLASRGIQLVRMPFRMERIYKTFNAALDATEVSRIQTVLGYAAANGISVILDAHNTGSYYLDNGTAGVAQVLGGATFTSAIFNDFWTRMVATFDGYSAVVGYDLMNEPVALSGVGGATAPGNTAWHTISQSALSAIRTAGSTKCVVVATDAGYCHPEDVAGYTPWITDPANNFRYTTHCYFDYVSGKDSSYNPGTTPQGQGVYSGNLASSKTAGFTGTDVSPTVAVGGVTDTFNRPDPIGAWTTLGCTEDASAAYWRSSLTLAGTDYNDGSFDWYINPIGLATNFNASSSACFVQTGLSDCTVQATLPTVGASSGGLWVRGSTDGHTGIGIDIGGVYETTRNSAGAPTFNQIASWTSPGYASGDIIKVILSGTSITVQRVRSGVTTTLGSATSAFNQTQKCHGLWCFSVSTPRTTWTGFSVA